jgi:hypothetical protein
MAHPNASGEEKMATKWFDAIQGVLKNEHLSLLF